MRELCLCNCRCDEGNGCFSTGRWGCRTSQVRIDYLSQRGVEGCHQVVARKLYTRKAAVTDNCSACMSRGSSRTTSHESLVLLMVFQGSPATIRVRGCHCRNDGVRRSWDQAVQIFRSSHSLLLLSLGDRWHVSG